MKKITMLFLSLLLALSVCGCGKGAGDSDAGSSQTSQSQVNSSDAGSEDTEGEGWEAGDGLRIVSVGSYAGLYVEDGSGDAVSDLCAITVENTGDQTVQYAELTMTVAGVSYQFNLTTLPSGKKAQLLDLNRQAPPETTEGLIATVSNYAAFTEEPSMNEDLLEITTQDTAITIKNNSDQDMSQVYVYYKLDYGDFYLGGITYRVGTTDLPAGQSATCYASHYTTDDCALMFTTYVY